MSAEAPVGFVYHPHSEWHDTGGMHPENNQRAKLIAARIRASVISGRLTWIEPVTAATAWIDRVHSPEYRQYVEESCLSGRSTLDHGETLVSEDSYYAALLSAGGALAAVDAVLRDGCRSAFSCGRPPGHHARTEMAMGFCIFNNVAIAACYAREHYNLDRVAIIDWDVHHGNGTQETFYGSPAVYFSSLHQRLLYPNTGESDEAGSGAGLGATVNVPLAPGATIADYRHAFDAIINPTLDAFRPELILISAGFDAHTLDPLAEIRLESEDFHELTGKVMALAERHCRGRIVSILEGGYHPEATPESVEAHLLALCGR